MPISTSSELDVFETIIKGQVIHQNNGFKYFKKCLEIIKDLYLFVFKLHRFHKYFFSPSYKQLSEEDYMIKIWSSLIETMFRSLDDNPPIIFHWGDTISEQVKDDGKIIRMNLRLIACETPIEQNKIIDIAVAKFTPKVFKSKYYKDKLKTVLAIKAQLNDLLRNNEDLDEKTLKDIAISFMTMMGLE